MSNQSTAIQRSQWEVDILLATENIAAAVEQWMKEFQSGIPVGGGPIQDEFQNLAAVVVNANEQWGRILQLKYELFEIVIETSLGDEKIREEVRQRCRRIWDAQEEWLNNYHETAVAVRAASEQLQSEIQRMAEVVRNAHQDCQDKVQSLLSEFGNKADDEKNGL